MISIDIDIWTVSLYACHRVPLHLIIIIFNYVVKVKINYLLFVIQLENHIMTSLIRMFTLMMLQLLLPLWRLLQKLDLDQCAASERWTGTVSQARTDRPCSRVLIDSYRILWSCHSVVRKTLRVRSRALPELVPLVHIAPAMWHVFILSMYHITCLFARKADIHKNFFFTSMSFDVYAYAKWYCAAEMQINWKPLDTAARLV